MGFFSRRLSNDFWASTKFIFDLQIVPILYIKMLYKMFTYLGFDMLNVLFFSLKKHFPINIFLSFF